MKFSASAKRAWIALYSVVAIVLFAWLLFPSDLIKQAIAKKIDSLAPGIETKIGALRSIFPPGVGLENIRIYHNGYERVHFDDLSVTPDILSAMGRRPEASFTGKLYDGQMAGDIQLEKGGRGVGIVFNSHFSEIDSKKHPAFQEILDNFSLSPLTGTLSYQTENDGRSGIGRLDIDSLSITLSKAILGFYGFAFDHIKVEALAKRNRVVIKKCSMTGPQADIEISGTMARGRSINQTRLNLTGVLTIKKSTENGALGDWLSQLFSGPNGASFKVRGSLSKPIFSLR